MSLLRALDARAAGRGNSTQLQDALFDGETVDFLDNPGSAKVFASDQDAILSLSLDQYHENKFLLMGNNRGAVSLYDVLRTSKSESSQIRSEELGHTRAARRRQRHFRSIPRGQTADPDEITPIARFGPGNLRSYHDLHRKAEKHGFKGHELAVSSVTWYTVDNGMFLSGGMDSKVMAWDTECFQPVFRFNALGRINCIAMSQAAALHGAPTYSLASVVTSDNRVSLVDVASCSAVHTLVGHPNEVISCVWSPTNPFCLITGGADGSIRMWDVRRGANDACLYTFDMYDKDVLGTDQKACGPSSTDCRHRRTLVGNTNQIHSREFYQERLHKASAALGPKCSSRTAAVPELDRFHSAASRIGPAAHRKSIHDQMAHLKSEDISARQTNKLNRAARHASDRSIAHRGAVTGLIFAASARSLRPSVSSFTEANDQIEPILFSTGTDNTIRAWRITAEGPKCKLTHFPGVLNTNRRHRAMAAICTSSFDIKQSNNDGNKQDSFAEPASAGVHLFHPNSASDRGASVTVYDALTGQQHTDLTGHFGSINAVVTRVKSATGNIHMMEEHNIISAECGMEVFSAGGDGMVLRWPS